MRRFLVVISTALVATTGCKQDAEGPATTQTASVQTPTNASASAKIAPPEGTGPAAKVNGTPIPRALYNRAYTQTLERYQKARHTVRPSLKERLKDNIVRRLVDMELINQQAKAMGIEVTGKEAEDRWAKHRTRYGTEEAFKAFLERAGTTEDDIRHQFSANLLREKLFSKVASEAAIDDAEVRKFYDDNVRRYTEPEQIKARHILIRKKPGADDKQIKEAKAKASRLLRQVKAKKKTFEDIAKENSEDVTKARGGDLGWFAKGRMVKPFETAVWGLKNGQVSKVVETSFGFHIIKREDFKKARTKPFTEVEPLIRRSLSARKRNQAIQDAMKKWRAEATIEIFEKGDPEIIKQDLARPAKKGVKTIDAAAQKKPASAPAPK